MLKSKRKDCFLIFLCVWDVRLFFIQIVRLMGIYSSLIPVLDMSEFFDVFRKETNYKDPIEMNYKAFLFF